MKTLTQIATDIAKIKDDDQLTKLHRALSRHEAIAGLYVAEIRKRQARKRGPDER